MIALQNPEFNITKYMMKNGHDFKEFCDLVQNISKFSNMTFDQRYKSFLQTSGLLEKIPESLDVNYLRRNGRSLMDAGKSASKIIKIKNLMNKTKYFSKKNNASFLETVLTGNDIQKIRNHLHDKINEEENIRAKRGIDGVYLAKQFRNFLLNPLMTWPWSFLIQEILNPIYDNDQPFFKRLRPEGYLTESDFLHNEM